MPKIFGREPALWLAFIGSLISLAGAYVIHLSTDQQGALNGLAAVILGLVTAVMTRDGLPAAILGVAKGALYVALAWHFDVPPDKQALILLAVSSAVAMFVRTQVTAPVPPVDPAPAVAAERSLRRA